MSLDPTYKLHPTFYNNQHYRYVIKRYESPDPTVPPYLQSEELLRFGNIHTGTRSHIKVKASLGKCSGLRLQGKLMSKVNSTREAGSSRVRLSGQDLTQGFE
jgi:hypothetical protein